MNSKQEYSEVIRFGHAYEQALPHPYKPHFFGVVYLQRLMLSKLDPFTLFFDR